MIVIDTNVVSELMRLAPDPAVMAWFSAQESAELYLTAVSEAELRAGAAILPAGRRRDRLAAEIDAAIGEDFAGRVLPFDSAAARAYAAIAASRPLPGPADPGGRLPDRRHRPGKGRRGRDPERRGFRGLRDRRDRSLDGGPDRALSSAARPPAPGSPRALR